MMRFASDLPQILYILTKRTVSNFEIIVVLSIKTYFLKLRTTVPNWLSFGSYLVLVVPTMFSHYSPQF